MSAALFVKKVGRIGICSFLTEYIMGAQNFDLLPFPAT